MISRLQTLKEFFAFLWSQRLWWLIPMIVIFFMVAILILFVGSSPLAPIVYPLF